MTVVTASASVNAVYLDSKTVLNSVFLGKDLTAELRGGLKATLMGGFVSEGAVKQR